MLDRPAFRTGFVTVMLFTLLAGDAWRYSVSWFGFGAIVVALTVVSVALLVRHRGSWSVGSLPIPLLAFLVLATVSLAWSFYPGSTALGVLTTWMTVTGAVAAAVVFSWDELLRALGTALRIILGLSIVFELAVSLIVRQPVLPLWVEYPEGKLPLMLLWSRNWLFDGGPIQGVVGNSSLLAFSALLGVIVFGLQLASTRVGRLAGWFWMLLAVAVIALTRSATVYLTLAALAFVLLAVWLIRRTRRRSLVYAGIAVVLGGGLTVALLFGRSLLPLLGKSSDLTGRLDIWEKVIGLAVQRPVAGWGWVSYWTPWTEPFDDLAIRHGVVQLHAHNTWLDVWLQLGILGLVVFGALALSALVRSWILATERPHELPGPLPADAAPSDLGTPQRPPFTVISLLPLLLMVALLVHSVAESRLLLEYGLFLLVLIAVKTRRADALEPVSAEPVRR
ncbi:MAG: O-antigen ligase family protein [Homoserinimonas sp.]